MWCRIWANHHTVIHADNQVTEAVINNGTARNSTCLELLKHLASLVLQFSFTISAAYIPGIENIMADTISCLHEPGKFDLLGTLFNVSLTRAVSYGGMTLNAWRFLSQGWSKLS